MNASAKYLRPVNANFVPLPRMVFAVNGQVFSVNGLVFAV